MAVTLIRIVGARPPAVWAAVTDFTAHANAVPLTTIRQETGEPGEGWRFVARTALGPLHVDDPMRITYWSPLGAQDEPEVGRFEIVKLGRVLAGWAQVEVAPGPTPNSTRLTWREEIDLAPLPVLTRPRLTRRVADVATGHLFDRAIDHFSAAARDLEAQTAGRLTSDDGRRASGHSSRTGDDSA